MGSWEWDIEKNVVSWSDEMYRLYGLKPKEFSLTYEKFLERVHPDDRTAVREAVEGARQNHQPFGFDHRIVRPDGAERVLYARGGVTVGREGRAVRMIGTGQDVTEKRLAEQALCDAHNELEKRVRERTAELGTANDAFVAEIVEHKRTAEALRDSRTRFQAIFENSIDAIGVSKNGIHVLANPAYLKMFGYRLPDEIAGKSILEFIAPNERELIRERIHRRAIGADAPTHYQTRGLRKDGTEFDLEVDVSLYKLKGEIHTLAILRDITERKHAEEEIRKLNVELEHRVTERTAQLEAINRELESFTYSVSHDLRAPLRAMQGLTRALQEDYSACLDDTGKDYACRIVSAAARMETLIQDLLVYSRLSRVDLESRPVNLSQVVTEVHGQLESEIREHGARVSVEGVLPSVIGHRTTLVQVVGNLVSNAIKFVAPGVTPQVTLRAEDHGERVKLWVEDNGIGIAPEYQERIFRIVERLHGIEAYPGTGIGLAIVQKGAERLGGRTGVDSAPDRGSKFWVELRKA